MLEEQVALITLLKEVISGYEDKLKEVETVNNSAITKYKKELDNIRLDYRNLTNIDLSIIREVLDEIQGTQLERDEIYNYIESIDKLLRLNNDHNTTYEVTEKQLNFLDLFFNKIDQVIGINNRIQQENMTIIGKISSTCNKYKELLSKLEDPDNNEFITNIDVMDSLFRECEVDEKTKRNILLSIMKYNKDIYDDIMSDKKSSNPKAKLTEEELISLLEKHSYDYSKLDEEIRENLLILGDKERIEDILNTLEEFNIYFTLPSNSRLFAIVLINCESKVFSNIVRYSENKGLERDKLLKLIPVLIAEANPIKTEEELIISGKSDDFVKNVEFFLSIDLDLNLIYDKCKALFLKNHYSLINNYNTLKSLGITITNEELAYELTSSKLSALLSNKFTEVAEQLLEVSPEGDKYVRDNLAQVGIINDPKDLIIYNIYASYQVSNSKGTVYIKEGPFIKTDIIDLKLRNEITRHNGSGYEDIPYREVTEDNKMEITNTIIPVMENYETFNRIIEESKYNNDLKIYNELEQLKSLEEYIDYKNPIKYNFLGISISRNKVARILNILRNYDMDKLNGSILFAITYNSILTEEEYNKIKNLLGGTE